MLFRQLVVIDAEHDRQIGAAVRSVAGDDDALEARPHQMRRRLVAREVKMPVHRSSAMSTPRIPVRKLRRVA